jgi:cation diffusion facilitator CzcD-associated flavoprotein CzcO
MDRPLRFVIVGAGMAGILSSIKLQEAGYDDHVLYEKADRLGGTWRENTYPGIACDVPSHLYSYSFDLNPEWSHLFSPGDEIEAYLERVAERHGVTERIRFGEEVVGCEWRDGRWRIETASGTSDDADVVIAATGVLHHPRYPDIEGLDTFDGALFHSARWDHSVSLDGARIGVIGTGSTAVQITGAVVDQVAELHLFQRTAQWILPQQNPAYTDEQRAAFRADPDSMMTLHESLSDAFGNFAQAVVDASSAQIQMIEAMCLANLEDNVRDPELKERLRPDYRAGCKRLVVSENFYDAIQRPNATLVTAGIECIEPGGIRTRDGELHELDIIVLATGFRTDAFLRPMDVVGRDGTTLAEVWRDRPNAYLSISIPDFPNLFMLNGPNGPVGNFSLIEVAELQFAYILQLVERLRTGEAGEVSATWEAMEAFEAQRVEAAKHTIWSTGCRSWYLDDRGVPAAWPFPFQRFREEMAAPNWDHYDVRAGSAALTPG